MPLNKIWLFKTAQCRLEEHRYYFSSLPRQEAAKILSVIRAHWRVESLHWILDVVFNEDGCRIRDEQAAENFSWLRKLAYKLLKDEGSFKANIRRKQRRANAKLD